VPLAMVANPDLIALDTAPFAALAMFGKVGAGLAAVSMGIIRPFHPAIRIALVAVGMVILFLPV